MRQKRDCEQLATPTDFFSPLVSFCWSFFGCDNCRCVRRSRILHRRFSRAALIQSSANYIHIKLMYPFSDGHIYGRKLTMRAESGQEISNKYNQLFIPRTHSVYYTCSAALFPQITVAALCNKAALVFVVSGSFEASAGDKKLASPCSCVGKGCLCGCCQHQFRP
jgi:hypothetical protein